jgi:hypothetical protein
MAEVAEVVEQEEDGLDDLVQEWESEKADAEAEASRPSAEEERRAKELAERMNAGFLWIVNRTQCPHVDIEEIVDREKGNEAFEPLAEKWGGEVPAWVQQFSPYIGAGVYMATTIVTARQIERQMVEEAERKEKAQGGQDGGESESRP